MDVIAISEFKATCLKLLEKVRTNGESLLVTKKGEPIAIVSPAPLPPKKRRFGTLKSTAKIKGDIKAPLNDITWDVLKK